MTLPGWAIVSCAAGSATVAVIFTHPADVVKTRLQVTLLLCAACGGSKLMLTLRLLSLRTH